MSFWHYHGLLWIFAMCFFPRLTMLFATTVGGGFLYWVGWVIAPRLTVAILATYYFWQTDTALVVLTWFWAMAGENAEKTGISKTVKRQAFPKQ